MRNDAALGVKEDQPRTGQFLDAEQIELLAQLAMVALLGFLQLGEILVEILLAEKRRAVDALQLRVLLVAFPVRARDRKQLERLDLLGGRHVRPAAEIDELRTQRVFGKNVARALRDQLDLHGLVGVELQSLVLLRVLALVGQVARLDLPHLLFDLFQILGSEGRVALEIVIETRVDRRADAELGLREQFQHRGRQKVRRRMPVHFERLGILGGQNLELGVVLEGPVQIPQIAVHARHNGVIRQPGADRPRDVQGPGSRRNALDTAVRKGDLYVVHG